MDHVKESEMFNQMAEYYDIFRPGYPTEIIHTIVEKARLTPASRVLEIGSGSGKATEQFADYGFEMLCMDPGEDLVQKGNQRFQDTKISFVASRFEDYALPSEHFDAIVSAQAFHWVPKPRGYELCSATLKKGGWLMPFWNIEIIHDTELDHELLAILEKYSAFTATMKNDDYGNRVNTKLNEITESGYFRKPEVFQKHWEKTYTADEYFGFVMTGNVFIQNSDSVKSACYHELQTLDAKYNGIKRHYICELYTAQKA